MTFAARSISATLLIGMLSTACASAGAVSQEQGRTGSAPASAVAPSMTHPYFVAVLANADNPLANPEQLAVQLADLALGGVHDEPAVDAARLRDYVGVYRIADDATRTITLDDGRLYSQRSGGSRLELRPLGDDLFLVVATGGRFRFERRDGAVVAMVLEPRLGMHERAEVDR
jgi:hypothetical protein